MNQPDKNANETTDLQIKFSELANCMFNFIATSFFSIFTSAYLVRTLTCNIVESLIFIVQHQCLKRRRNFVRFLFSNDYNVRIY